MVAQELADKKKEIEDWNKKVVVKNTHFYVNTMEKKKVTAHLDKFKNIREGDAKKFGLKNRKANISKLVERQILGTKQIEDAPVSMMKEEPYVRKGYQPPYKVFDKSLTMGRDDLNTNV